MNLKFDFSTLFCHVHQFSLALGQLKHVDFLRCLQLGKVGRRCDLVRSCLLRFTDLIIRSQLQNQALTFIHQRCLPWLLAEKAGPFGGRGFLFAWGRDVAVYLLLFGRLDFLLL